MEPFTIIHEGRGGRVEIEGRRYSIEHVEGGRFCIHVPSRAPASDRQALEALCLREPEKWSIEPAAKSETGGSPR